MDKIVMGLACISSGVVIWLGSRLSAVISKLDELDKKIKGCQNKIYLLEHKGKKMS